MRNNLDIKRVGTDFLELFSQDSLSSTEDFVYYYEKIYRCELLLKFLRYNELMTIKLFFCGF